MTPEELLNKDKIGKSFVATPPPAGTIRAIGEFEPMEGVLIRYPFGIPYPLIAALSQQNKLYTIVATANQQATVTTNYTNNGVNLANCEWIIAPTDSYWTRDYGPWYIHYGNYQTGIVDFPYNRPRPNDDEIPKVVADLMGISWFGMNIVHTGGNIMTLGTGTSASTDLVVTENVSTWTASQLDSLILAYMGVSLYHKVPDPNNTYIDHIDCWGKYLAPDKVLIRSVPTTHPQYNDIEATATYFANQITPYGTPFKIFRVNTANNEPYTNSLILNKQVFVPLKGVAATDTAAMQAYQTAMPGYQILGFTGSWQSTDALHCRAIGLADRGMLEIIHSPILGNQPIQSQYIIHAEINDYSLLGLYPDSTLLFYKVNNGIYNSVVMTCLGGNQYEAVIPAFTAPAEYSYYIYAADSSGRNNMHPYVGPAEPHVFNTGTVGIQTPEANSISGLQLSIRPNPCSDICTLEFKLESLSPVKIQVFDIQGKEISTLQDGPLGLGIHHICWNTTTKSGVKAAPGLYFCVLTVNGIQTSSKILVR